MKIIRAYKYRLYPTKNQRNIIDTTFGMCRDLYNAALQERIEAYKKCNISLSCYDQQNELPLLKELNPQYEFIYSQILQDVLKRLDKSFKSFFRRLKLNRKKAGFPRFKGKDRYDSFTYPQGGFKVIDKKLSLSKIGYIKLKMNRLIEGQIKTCTIKRELDRYYAIFMVEKDVDIPSIEHRTSVGIDLGLTHFATLSDNTKIDNPRYLKQSLNQLKKEQKRLSSKKKGSNNRKKKRFIVAKVHRKIKDQRNDFLHKTSRDIVNKYDMIFMEDLNIQGMIKNRKLARSISDVSWGKFNDFISYKAEEAGKVYKQVNTFYPSSKVCHVCGYKKIDLKLSYRIWICPQCGKSVNRDLNASKNIEFEGLKQIGLGKPESKLVERSTLSSLKQEYVRQSYALSNT